MAKRKKKNKKIWVDGLSSVTVLYNFYNIYQNKQTGLYLKFFL